MKILNKVILRHLTLNKKRTIVTIIGIILSTCLMVGIGLLVSSVKDYSINEVKKYNGSYHIELSDIDMASFDKLKDEDISYYYEQLVGYSKIDSDKEYIAINNVNEAYFNELELISGRFAKNSDEIVITTNLDYEIGDVVTFDLANRVSENKVLLNGKKIENEEFINTFSKTYKIVGIVKVSNYESYDDIAYDVYTTGFSTTNNMNLYIEFNEIKDIINKANALANKIDYDIDNINYNTALLALYGQSTYNNVNEVLITTMVIMLLLISVGCIMVIYNSFNISFMERKKEIALFSSVGATKKQILFSMLFEAFILGFIGIIIGLIASFVGIKIVLIIINYLIKDALGSNLNLVIDYIYIIIPIIFMFICIFISSIIPAVRVSSSSVINVIFQNDEIKLDNKKIKPNKLVNKLFGVYGDIALKSIKRSKKKYRISVISLCVSIVLFITFSTYLMYTTNATSNFLNTHDYDIVFSLYDNKLADNLEVKSLLNSYDIDKKVEYRISSISIVNDINNYSKEYLDIQKNLLESYDEFINRNVIDIILIGLDNESYFDYLSKLGVDEEKIIVLNNYDAYVYDNNNRKLVSSNVFNNEFNIKACKSLVDNDCNYNINNVTVSNTNYLGLDLFKSSNNVKLVVSEDMFDYLFNNYHIKNSDDDILSNVSTYYVIKADNYNKLDEIGNNLVNKYPNDCSYNNVTKSMQLENNIVLVLKILMYGFISLIVLIGITSVFNTINTSIMLRKREFAILRSVGLTNKGFSKILFFESLFIALKAIIYGLIISFGLIILINYTFSSLESDFYIPYFSIIISIIVVFLIVLVTMFHSSKKIRKDSIIKQIRQENI